MQAYTANQLQDKAQGCYLGLSYPQPHWSGDSPLESTASNPYIVHRIVGQATQY